MKKISLVVILLLCAAAVNASGMNVQIKRVNPGIAQEKPAEIIFDVVNTNLDYSLKGFIRCNSPDDAFVEGTEGIASGYAQYLSQMFEIGKGPSQKSITVKIGAETEGDKRTTCIIKYIPFNVIETNETDIITEMQERNITENITVETFNNETNETEMVIEQVNKTIEEPINTEIVSKVMKRNYLLMNGEYIEQAADSDYREIRLDKVIPFAGPAIKEPACPDNKSECSASEVVDMGGFSIPAWIIAVAISLLLFGLGIALGRKKIVNYINGDTRDG